MRGAATTLVPMFPAPWRTRIQQHARFAMRISAMNVVIHACRWACHQADGRLSALLLAGVLAGVLGGILAGPVQGQQIENGIANFAALDKVTAGVKQLPIGLNQTAQFRTLKITPRVCYTRDPREPPRTSTFVEVDEILIDGKQRRIFTGWMFAESPGLNPLAHPVFDLWLTGCAQPQRVPTAKGPGSETVPAFPRGEVLPPPRRRVPR